MESVTIPVMAKCRIGHFAEAQILQSLGVDFIDESEGSFDYFVNFEFSALILSPCQYFLIKRSGLLSGKEHRVGRFMTMVFSAACSAHSC